MRRRSIGIRGAAVGLAAVAGVGALVWGLTRGGSPFGVHGAQAAAAAASGAASGAPALRFTAAEVTRPQRERLPRGLEFSGPLVAPQTAVVRAKAPGTLLALQVSEGSRVAAGQVLGRIDVAEQASRVSERGAQTASARAALAQAERTHQMNERLAEQSFISAMALEQSRATLDAARAAVRAAQAGAETARLGLRDALLVAPIAGVVAKRHVLAGEKLASEQPVVTLVDVARLELAASVGAHEVAALAPGQPVAVQVEGSAASAPGRVARIAPAADAGTRAIGVTIALDNPGERWRAGQYALARVELPDDVERWTLPAAAVDTIGGQSHVWLIERGALARRAVQLGRRDAARGRVEVLGGLPPDAQVLALRFENLREGSAAQVSGAASGASGAASTALAAAGALGARPR